MKKEQRAHSPYTCQEYRAEMVLLSLNQRLNNNNLSQAERAQIKAEIKELETEMGMA